MADFVNLAQKMAEFLPGELSDFLRTASAASQNNGERLYLVGGTPRDLLTGKASYDIDLVVEGDGVRLANLLAGRLKTRVITYPRFGTAKMSFGEWDIDITTARSETYRRPGALPAVKPGSLNDDLSRRDFTINAMAISLSPESYGELVDPHGGREDLAQGLIRILYENSFVDDATRIFRALRYAARFGFRIEENTRRLLERGVRYLDTISGDRIRYELECIFREDFPEKALALAHEFGALKMVHPGLKAGRHLRERFRKAREMTAPEEPPVGLYLTLLTHNLGREDIEKIIVFLRLDRALARILRGASEIKEKLTLAEPELTPSQIYHLLHGYSVTAIQAVSLATDSDTVRERIDLYLRRLRYVKAFLTGEDLKGMGVPEGPQMKELLKKLLDARLDGKVTSREGEEEMVKGGRTSSGKA